MYAIVPHPSGKPVLIWADQIPPNDLRNTHTCIPFEAIFEDSDVCCESRGRCLTNLCPFAGFDNCRPQYTDFINSLNLHQSYPEFFL